MIKDTKKFKIFFLLTPFLLPNMCFAMDKMENEEKNQYKIAKSYEKSGQLKEAAENYKNAADKGNDKAAYCYGRMCLSRQDIEQNKEEGIKYLELAQDLGNKDAEYVLSVILNAPANVTTSQATSNDDNIRNADRFNTAPAQEEQRQHDLPRPPSSYYEKAKNFDSYMDYLSMGSNITSAICSFLGLEKPASMLQKVYFSSKFFGGASKVFYGSEEMDKYTMGSGILQAVSSVFEYKISNSSHDTSTKIKTEKRNITNKKNDGSSYTIEHMKNDHPEKDVGDYKDCFDSCPNFKDSMEKITAAISLHETNICSLEEEQMIYDVQNFALAVFEGALQDVNRGFSNGKNYTAQEIKDILINNATKHGGSIATFIRRHKDNIFSCFSDLLEKTDGDIKKTLILNMTTNLLKEELNKGFSKKGVFN